MTGLMNLHALAAPRGDGLHPKLLELFRRRAAIEASNGNVVDLGPLQEGAFTQAGPSPKPAVPEFLPGNVVSFRPAARTNATAGNASQEGRTSCTSP
ncbi:hypothetical protein [Mesorhizobium sp. CAU 1741]|uniref:hypothetical protein n=1 Tax=Mesorhizobium sp. CAU 1741 TaxID=3140366 RepID=UPI00325A808C